MTNTVSHIMPAKTGLKNFNLSLGSYKELLHTIIDWGRQRRAAMICVANVHMFIEAQSDASFMKIVNEADMVTPDGKPLCWALKLLNNIQQERVAGMDLLPDLLKQMEQERLSAYFYGGSQQMLDSTREYLATNLPELKIAGMYSPPFRAVTAEETAAIATEINNTAPHILFVILGCPKQEKWMAENRHRLQTVMIGVGGALPVLTGMQKRSPQWMQDAGLEWLYRLGQEPRRLFKRYAVTNSRFIAIITKEYFKKLFTKKKEGAHE
ncbi:MAG: WecB/TagA/CpsF family glycosyltransferase [Ferruginibacter sp.]